MKQFVWVANPYVTEISKPLRDYVGFFVFPFFSHSLSIAANQGQRVINICKRIHIDSLRMYL